MRTWGTGMLEEGLDRHNHPEELCLIESGTGSYAKDRDAYGSVDLGRAWVRADDPRWTADHRLMGPDAMGYGSRAGSRTGSAYETVGMKATDGRTASGEGSDSAPARLATAAVPSCTLARGQICYRLDIYLRSKGKR